MGWEIGRVLVVFKYLKNGHLREEITIVCYSEGTGPSERYREADFGKCLVESGCLTPNVTIILTRRMMKWRQVWFFVKLCESNQDRNLNWVISKVHSNLEKLWTFDEYLCYLKWGCLCICPSTLPFIDLSMHYASTCASIHPLLSYFKTQWTYFTPLTLLFFWTSVYWLAPLGLLY